MNQLIRHLINPAKGQGVCRDLDPQAPYWLSLGGLAGFSFYILNGNSKAPLHQLLHQRGNIQPITVVAGGMVLGFIALKLFLLIREQQLIKRHSYVLQIDGCDDVSVEAALARARNRQGVLMSRWRSLLEFWSVTHSSTKVGDRLETETEAFDLAQQNSYALPRIVVWAIPILGFIGTVIGIGSAVGQFDSFLSNADDIDVLREGLAQVTGGLGTAFDTTFLALSISLLVMLPLAAVERIEQRILTRIDLLLRKAILNALPDTASSNGAGVDQKALESVVGAAFQKHLPDPEVLVQPAIAYAEHAARAITAHLDPIKTLAADAAAAITEARADVRAQANDIKDSLANTAMQLNDSVLSLHPLLDQLSKVEMLSSELDHELKQLHTGARLSELLIELSTILASVDQTLVTATKPRRVVLIEQADEVNNDAKTENGLGQLRLGVAT